MEQVPGPEREPCAPRDAVPDTVLRTLGGQPGVDADHREPGSDAGDLPERRRSPVVLG